MDSRSWLRGADIRCGCGDRSSSASRVGSIHAPAASRIRERIRAHRVAGRAIPVLACAYAAVHLFPVLIAASLARVRHSCRCKTREFAAETQRHRDRKAASLRRVSAVMIESSVNFFLLTTTTLKVSGAVPKVYAVLCFSVPLRQSSQIFRTLNFPQKMEGTFRTPDV